MRRACARRVRPPHSAGSCGEVSGGGGKAGSQMARRLLRGSGEQVRPRDTARGGQWGELWRTQGGTSMWTCPRHSVASPGAGRAVRGVGGGHFRVPVRGAEGVRGRLRVAVVRRGQRVVHGARRACETACLCTTRLLALLGAEAEGGRAPQMRVDLPAHHRLADVRHRGAHRTPPGGSSSPAARGRPRLCGRPPLKQTCVGW